VAASLRELAANEPAAEAPEPSLAETARQRRLARRRGEQRREGAEAELRKRREQHAEEDRARRERLAHQRAEAVGAIAALYGLREAWILS
jgi:hypothetical protein